MQSRVLIFDAHYAQHGEARYCNTHYYCQYIADESKLSTVDAGY
jgi:hypothetical protein